MRISEFINKYSALWLGVLTLVFAVFFSRYAFYSRDHYSQLPTILHYFDNALYQRDHEMQLLNPIAVKVVLHLILYTIAKITTLSPMHVYFGAYIINVFFVFYLTYKITYKMYGSSIAGVLPCLLIFLLSDNIDLASSRFFIQTRAVVPYFAGLALHLFCFYLVLQQRRVWSVIICGVLFFIHGQISLFTATAVFTVIGFSRQGLLYFVKCLGLYVLLISPVIVSLVMNFGNPDTGEAQYSILELTKFRVPHHIFPRTHRLVIFFCVIVAIVAMLRLGKNHLKKEVPIFVYPLIGVYLAGIVFTRFIPVDFVLIMYLLRVDTSLRIIFFILFSGNIIRSIRRLIRKERFNVRHWVELGVVSSLLLFLTVVYARDPIGVRKPKISPPKGAYADMARYARDNTPKDTLFITPPHGKGFRLHAERSNLVEFKINPIGRGHKLQDEWMNRILALCNVKKFKRKSFGMRKECRKGYYKMTRSEFEGLCKTYDADYFVTGLENPFEDRQQGLVHKNRKYSLYECP